jgi:hypothetical protein
VKIAQSAPEFILPKRVFSEPVRRGRRIIDNFYLAFMTGKEHVYEKHHASETALRREGGSIDTTRQFSSAASRLPGHRDK